MLSPSSQVSHAHSQVDLAADGGKPQIIVTDAEIKLP